MTIELWGKLMKQKIAAPVAGGGPIHAESFAVKVLNASLNGIYIYDVTLGRNVFINDQYTTLTGYTLADLNQLDRDHFLALFHPEDLRRVTGQMEKLAHGSHENLESEYRFKTKDGRWIWCLARHSPFDRDQGDGSVSQFIGTFLDITQRKEAEQTLAHQRELLQGIYDTIPVLFVLWDPRLRTFTLNQHAESVFGWTTAEANQGDFMAKIYPDPAYRAEVIACIRSLEPGWREWTVMTRDGRSMPILWANIRLSDETMVGIGVDQRERKKSEAALRQSEDKFSKAFHSSPTFLFISELENGVFIEVNNAYCKTIGYTREEMIGRSSVELGIISAPERSELIRKLKGAGRLQDIELKIATRTGEAKVCLFAAEPMEYQGRSCLIYSGFDITGRKHADEILNGYREKLEREVSNRTAEIQTQYAQLEELNLLVKQMAQHTIRAMENDRRALSKEIHDSIGGSLAAVKIMLETRLLDFDRSPPDGIISIEKIIGYLADAIQESRRISYQMRTLVLDDFGLAAALSENFKKFKEIYPQIDIVSKIEISEEGISDEIKTVVYRVVQEALNNIGKHSGADRATITLSDTKGQISLRIEDNGCGFDFTKMMGAYQSLQGYGMHSMKERVEICKGTFEVTSAPGKGTVLSASLPKTAL
ncbi:MAG: PAS domain S-box protein [Desulfobacterales bacterium]